MSVVDFVDCLETLERISGELGSLESPRAIEIACKLIDQLGALTGHQNNLEAMLNWAKGQSLAHVPLKISELAIAREVVKYLDQHYAGTFYQSHCYFQVSYSRYIASQSCCSEDKPSDGLALFCFLKPDHMIQPDIRETDHQKLEKLLKKQEEYKEKSYNYWTELKELINQKPVLSQDAVLQKLLSQDVHNYSTLAFLRLMLEIVDKSENLLFSAEKYRYAKKVTQIRYMIILMLRAQLE